MATIETITMAGGPLDGEVREGVFGPRIYLDAALQPVEPAIMQDNLPNVTQQQHRYRRGLPLNEFIYEGYF